MNVMTSLAPDPVHTKSDYYCMCKGSYHNYPLCALGMELDVIFPSCVWMHNVCPIDSHSCVPVQCINTLFDQLVDKRNV